MVNGVAELTEPETCGSEEHCITECRDDAIQMAWVPMEGDPAIGQWRRFADREERLSPVLSCSERR